MFQNQRLTYLLERYLGRLDDLEIVKKYVTLYVGEVDNELLDYISLEIWHFEDDLISEDDFRSRLASILRESKLSSIGSDDFELTSSFNNA